MGKINGNPDTLITLTTGKQDRGTRATLAFSWGCASLAMGQTVSIYLTMEGTIWATKGANKGVEVGGFEPLSEYMEQFSALGGEILVCAPCSQYYCSEESLDLSKKLIEQAKLAGLATVVSKLGEKTKMVTF